MSEPRVKSEMLRDLLLQSEDNTKEDGNQALAVQTIGTPPYKLVTLIEDAIEKLCTNVINKCAAYVTQHITNFKSLPEHEQIRAEQAKSIGFKQMATSFVDQFKIRQRELEKFIYRKFYKFDDQLYKNGWIRPDNCEGVDFTDPQGAHKLAEECENSEKNLLEVLTQLQSARIELESSRLEEHELVNTIQGLKMLERSETEMHAVYTKLT